MDDAQTAGADHARLVNEADQLQALIDAEDEPMGGVNATHVIIDDDVREVPDAD